MQTLDSYLDRKRREIAVLDRSLRTPLRIPAPASPAEAIEQKLKLAAALRAEQSLQSWAVTETARPATQRWRTGGFEFNYGYQRADLSVRGPPIYPALSSPGDWPRPVTIYTGSGMSAIAALIVALLQSRATLDVVVSADGYGETRELMRSFRDRLRLASIDGARRLAGNDPASMRILWLDSCVRKRFFASDRAAVPGVDLIVFDTTCFWRDSGRVRRVVAMARRGGVPVALVRSHAKLDVLGIEYGRLGSIVVAPNGPRSTRAPRIGSLVAHLRDTVRLLGAAPIPVHFPPFAGGVAFDRCSRERTASIMRNTRRLERRLRAALGDTSAITAYQHGAYLTLASRGPSDIDNVQKAAADLAGTLASRGLPVAHAGSFGFDFVAIEWFPDPLAKRNVLRIAGADLPTATIDRIADGVAAWWSARNGVAVVRGPRRCDSPKNPVIAASGATNAAA